MLKCRLLDAGALSHRRPFYISSSQGQESELRLRLSDDILTLQYYTPETFPISQARLVLACLYAYAEGIDTVGELCRLQVQATPPGSHARASAHQLHSRMMRRHVLRQPIKAAIYRDQLDNSLADFPSNTQFLTLYIDHERRAGLQTRVYSHILGRARKDASLVEIIWSIWAMCRVSRNIFDKDSGGNARVRAVLSKAVTSDRYDFAFS